MSTKVIDRSEALENKILLIRGQRVMIDRDLAELYNVQTKVLNQTVKRNAERFPSDFMFKLTKKEKDEPVTNCDRFNSLKHSTPLPYVFTEHGAVMLILVLNQQAIIQIITLNYEKNN
ncbi:MAG: ORF6N domain-containing protein [Melioribacteraceae bacterium]|nr:ORF6N domain-containing protein [Melioribacteraceae bacterium]MCF8396210.1 ORF6N domain-containing protein [Melioribacteraceae bacterium]